jgi:hypothetical protein
VARYLNCLENIPGVNLGLKRDSSNHLRWQTLDFGVLSEAVSDEQKVDLLAIEIIVLLDDSQREGTAWDMFVAPHACLVSVYLHTQNQAVVVELRNEHEHKKANLWVPSCFVNLQGCAVTEQLHKVEGLLRVRCFPVGEVEEVSELVPYVEVESFHTC